MRLGGFKIRAEADGFMPFEGETKILPASSPDFALQLQRQAEAPADAKAAEEARKAFAAGDLIAAAKHYEEFLALHEWFAFHEGLEKGLAGESLTGFYHLARSRSVRAAEILLKYRFGSAPFSPPSDSGTVPEHGRRGRSEGMRAKGR